MTFEPRRLHRSRGCERRPFRRPRSRPKWRRFEGTLGSADDFREGQPSFFGDRGTGVELGTEMRRLGIVPREFAGDGTKRRRNDDRLTREDPPVMELAANAQAWRFREKNLLQRGDRVFGCEYGDHDARSVLLHENGGIENIECASGEQASEDVAQCFP